MTNAEKFLKNRKATEELIATMESELPLSYVDVAQFWEKTCKPTLTDDERVILRNIHEEKIGRLENGNLYISYGMHNKYIPFFKDLFQSIKERRRILY